jgi:hypothetical protein
VVQAQVVQAVVVMVAQAQPVPLDQYHQLRAEVVVAVIVKQQVTQVVQAVAENMVQVVVLVLLGKEITEEAARQGHGKQGEVVVQGRLV